MNPTDSEKTAESPPPPAPPAILPRPSISSATNTPPPSYPPSCRTSQSTIDLEGAQPKTPAAEESMKFKTIIKTPLGQFWILSFLLTIYNIVMLMLGQFLDLDGKTTYLAKVIRVAPAGAVMSFIWLSCLGFLCACNEFTFEKTRWSDVVCFSVPFMPWILAPWYLTMGHSRIGS